MNRLQTLEHEILNAKYEAFVYIGLRLAEIRDRRLYESENYRSWSAYCAAGRLEFSKHQAERLIRASSLRPKLVPIGTNRQQWTESHLRELSRCETDNDAKRVARKAVSHAKKTGERVTAKLIANIRDGADETGAAEKKRAARLETAKLEKHLDKLASILVQWSMSLDEVDPTAWEDVPREILTRVKMEARKLAARKEF